MALTTDAVLTKRDSASERTVAGELKPGWRVVRFGDMVRNVDVSERQPLEQGLERFVGLDHLDPESLHIKRWGLIEEGTSFTRKFVSGQVLFGKRRAYQRKAAAAEFDGICSGDILVFEPKGDELLPELLPFIVQSDGFFEHALGTSAGSLSPRTKWSDLARYEFALPPKDEQRRIADILWAAEDLTRNTQIVQYSQEQVMDSLMDELLSYGIDEDGRIRNPKANPNSFVESPLGKRPSNWETNTIESRLERIIDYRGKTPSKTTSGVPLITAKNVREGYIDEEPREFIAEADYKAWMTRGFPQRGDILFTTEAPLGNVAEMPTYKLALAQRIITLRPDERILDSKFLYWLLMWSRSQQRIQQKGSGTTVLGIKQSVFRKILFQFPPIEEQQEIALLLNSCKQSLKAVELQNQKVSQLKKSLVQELLVTNQ